MRILAITGSPRGKGNTSRIIKNVVDEIQGMDSSVEFEEIVLKDSNLQLCRGCYLCLKKGEQYCPLQDERDKIERKMQQADGVIFASPVYALNVSWIMKNFIDRFAYICHRPRFHKKRAMVVSTTGGVGLKFVLFILGFEVGMWGFNVTQKLGVVCPPGEVLEVGMEKITNKTQNDIQTAAKGFYQSLRKSKLKKPGLIGLISFQLQKYAFSGAERDLADYQYWKAKGWIEPSAKYYYNVTTNPISRFVASLVVKLWYAVLPKPPNVSGKKK